jgi:hypothetical protein
MARDAKKEDVREPTAGVHSAQVEQIAAHLACGKTWNEIVRDLGVDHATIRRLMRRAEFRALVGSTRRANGLSVAGRLSKAAEDAVARLELAVSHAPDSIAVRAAEVILTQHLKYEEALSTDERLSRIEEKLGLLEDAIPDAERCGQTARTEGSDANPE